MNDLSENQTEETEVISEKPTLKNKVFEALGAASMCWEPRPSTQVFDSISAEKIGKDLMEQIESDIPNAMKSLRTELAKDKSEGSYYYGWQSDIAMAMVDAMINDGYVLSDKIYESANKAAKNFLELLISQTK